MKSIAIRENHLFAKVYGKGKRCATPSVVVYTLRDLHAGLLKKQHPKKIIRNRIGLTVTKKLGGAVERNRIKRRLRAAYAEICKQYNLKVGNLIVLVARSATLDVSFDVLLADLLRGFQKTGLILEEEQSKI